MMSLVETAAVPESASLEAPAGDARLRHEDFDNDDDPNDA